MRKTLVLAVIALLALTALSGCSATQQAGTPEEGLQAAYHYCGSGQLEKAVEYFDQGREAWANAPEYVAEVCDKVTDKKRARAFEITAREVTGDQATFTTVNYLDTAKQQKGSTLKWRCFRRSGRWLIEKVG